MNEFEKEMDMQNLNPEKTRLQSQAWLKIVLMIAFLVAVALTAYFTFIAVRDFVTAWRMTSLPGVSILDPTSTPDASGVIRNPSEPMQPLGGPTPPPWDGANRVTMLLMGLDYRDWAEGEGPPRTDTMILFTLDPLGRTAGILSIPRDLWVNIPGGYKYGRINTAYQLGEAYKYPDGGGPGLAMATVEELLGVPIDFYAQIDFNAFVQFIDEIGGVKIDVPENMKIDPLGDNNTYRLKKGRQTLPGNLALAYARARYTEGGDFDRAQRQQQVIMAIRDRMLEVDNLPRLISRAPALYNELSSGIHTNMNLDQAIRLAWLASQIPEENIKKGIIGPPDQVTFATSPDGSQQVLKPITDKIRLLRDEIFSVTSPASPLATTMSLEELAKLEGAKVSVLNGSYTPGLAARTSDYLKTLGINVVVTDNAQQLTSLTEITYYNGKPYTLKYLVEQMKINPNRIFHFFDPASVVDLTITLGDDWANNNPMP